MCFKAPAYKSDLQILNLLLDTITFSKSQRIIINNICGIHIKKFKQHNLSSQLHKIIMKYVNFQ
jgi:hypothetical protein